jgi:hypothetical protein
MRAVFANKGKICYNKLQKKVVKVRQPFYEHKKSKAN